MELDSNSQDNNQKMTKAILVRTDGKVVEVDIKLSEKAQRELDDLKIRLGLDKLDELNIRC